MIIIKSAEEIRKMKDSGRIAHEVMQKLINAVQPDTTTAQLDEIARKEIERHHAEGSFKDYRGYPAYICASVNDEIVHGIPSHSRVLREGDIIGIDLGVYYKGYHADMARTIPVGAISKEAQALIDVAKRCFEAGVKNFEEGRRLHEICAAIENTAKQAGCTVPRELVGHGIGQSLHEPPDVPNFKPGGWGVRLKKGMTLAIEPMINAGGPSVLWDNNGWTARTADKALSSHYENTVALTDNGTLILTCP
jgi:methionyl aminopeptidase